MRVILIFIVFLLSYGCFAQTYLFDGKGNIIAGTHIRTKPGEELKLIDSINNNCFLLDSAHINIYALKQNHDTLWTTDPWKDNNIKVYRTKRPIIVQFDFAKNKWTDNKEVIWIVYNNTQFGIIDKRTGEFTWFGQD